MPAASFRPFIRAALLLAVAGLSACATRPQQPRVMTAHECMTRVMYFESNRSSAEGMIAVGSVVMNRLHSGRYPKTVCGVVGQKNQFAPGVLTRDMEAGRDLAAQMATKVLKGARHPDVGEAMFFHTAGMTFPYTNMHYLVEAGGNVFYEKRRNARQLSDPPFRNGMRGGGGYAALAPQPVARPVERVAVERVAVERAVAVPSRQSAPVPVPAAMRIEDLIEAGRF